MVINKLTATFGKLDGESLELHEGLNVICAPNESGKSTWCAFIRAMLYGVSSSEQKRIGYLPDKLRYAPWSGASMQGQMELSSDGRDITLTRTTKLKTAPMREFSAVYTGTNVKVEGLSASDAGEKLTGVTHKVFRRSAFIEQGAVAVSGDPEIEKRISAIVSTGDEGCSFTEASERLKVWQRSRRYNKRGRLPELESKMSDIKSTLAELEDGVRETERVKAELNACRAECAALEVEMTESRKRERLSALSELHDMREQRDAAQAAHELAAVKLDKCRAAKAESCLNGKDPDGLMSKAESDAEKCRELRTVSEKKISSLPQTLVLILGVVLAVLSATVFPKSIMIYGVIAAALLCVASVFMCLSTGRLRMAAGEAKADLREILEKYAVSTEDDICGTVNEYLELCAALFDAEAEEKRRAEELSEIKAQYEGFEAKTVTKLDFASGSSEAVEIGRRLNAAKLKCESLSARLSEKRGAMSAAGDPLVLGSELKSMESLHAELSAEYDAIGLALSTLSDADTEIQSRFSPELSRKAAEYMSLITGGRYESVLINRDFSAKTKTSGDSVSHESIYLSAGTLDLMYLAVRLAVCELALPEGASCPLILDDTLVNLDAERTQQAMELLGEISKRRQVILFTACQKSPSWTFLQAEKPPKPHEGSSCGL